MPSTDAADHLQRCAELVRDVGQQLAAPLFVGAEAFGHLVERGGSEPSWPEPGLDPPE